MDTFFDGAFFDGGFFDNGSALAPGTGPNVAAGPAFVTHRRTQERAVRLQRRNNEALLLTVLLR